MTTNRPIAVIALLAIMAISQAPARAAIITIDTVPVGNAGNAGAGTFGAVAYEYRIGTYEVTNSQYAAFLNAVAATDSFFLYSSSMGSDPRGGIDRSGASGSFTYAAKFRMDDKPVNFVTWYDAVRFTNWLHNNQPTGEQGNGTTETGAYTLLGGTTEPSNGLTVTRNPGATWFLPSENEWFKAAYYNPVTQSYFTYPTSSNTTPTVATANSDNGNISNPGTNVANYFNGADWKGQNGNVTTVGSAGAMSASPYLTFDQGGNVTEWTESLFSATSTSRVHRGGSWNSFLTNLNRGTRSGTSPFGGANNNTGFRVATVAAVPEPSTWLLVVLIAASPLVVRIRSI